MKPGWKTYGRAVALAVALALAAGCAPVKEDEPPNPEVGPYYLGFRVVRDRAKDVEYHVFRDTAVFCWRGTNLLAVGGRGSSAP